MKLALLYKVCLKNSHNILYMFGREKRLAVKQEKVIIMPGFEAKHKDLKIRHIKEKLDLLAQEEAAAQEERKSATDPRRIEELREILMRCEANGKALDNALKDAQR